MTNHAAIQRLPLQDFLIAADAPLIQDPSAWRRARRLGLSTGAVTVDGRVVPFRMISQSDEPRPVAVLVHGMGITPATFWPISGYLFATHDLLLVDYNSFTAPAQWPLGGLGLRLLAAGVAQVISVLDLHNVALVGSSLGGGLSLLATMMAPERVDRLVLINPAVYPQDLPLRYRLAAFPLIGPWALAVTPPRVLIGGVAGVGYVHPDGMAAELRAVYERNLSCPRSRRILRDVMAELSERGQYMTLFLENLSRLRQPMLIVWGQHDHLLPEDTGRRLAHDAPHAILHEYAELAHLPHEEAPDQVGPVIENFFLDDGPAT